MTVIPVIDLMQGQVVRGVGGQRSAYRPVVSTLCAGSDPVAVARALCEHCAAAQLYVADLDALQGGAPQADVVQALLTALPSIELWLDGGFTEAADAQRLRAALGPLAERVVPVFASESLGSAKALRECFGSARRDEAILSLDRRGPQRLDPAGCWEAAALWPRRVIVMTLERVGSGAGPDLEMLAELQALAPATRFIGAGGIRHQPDLDRAHEAGAAAWLVASALHEGRLPRLS